MTIGEKRSEKVHFGDTMPVTKTGTVVWIHPRRIFYVVEFDFLLGRIRESYFFLGRGGNEG